MSKITLDITKLEKEVTDLENALKEKRSHLDTVKSLFQMYGVSPGDTDDDDLMGDENALDFLKGYLSDGEKRLDKAIAALSRALRISTDEAKEEIAELRVQGKIGAEYRKSVNRTILFLNKKG